MSIFFIFFYLCSSLLSPYSGDLVIFLKQASYTQACCFEAIRTWNRASVTAATRVSDPHCFNADPDTDPDPAFF